jgi:hypothetical protein
MNQRGFVAVVFVCCVGTAHAMKNVTSTKGMSTRPIEMEETSGIMLFDLKGEVHLGARTAHLIIVVDLNKLERSFNQFRERILKQKSSQDVRFTDYSFMDMEETWNRYNDSKSMLSSIGSTRNTRNRDKRDIGSWLGGLFGMFNQYEIGDIKSKQEHEDEAIRATVHEVEAIKEFAESNERNMKRVEKEIEALEEDRYALDKNMKIDLRQRSLWKTIRSKMRAATTLNYGVVDHKMSSETTNLVDLKQIWKKFTGRLKAFRWRAAITQHQHLYARKVDYHLNNARLRITLNIPIVEHNRNGHDLYRFKNRPFMMGEQITQVQTEERYLARQQATGAYTVLDESDLEDCIREKDSYFCEGSYVAFSHPGQSCLEAVFNRQWNHVKRTCQLVHRPMTTGAWTVSGNRFTVISNETVQITVKCTGLEQMSMSSRGMKLIGVRRDCSLSMPHLTLVPRAGNNKKEIEVVAEMGLSQAVYTEQEGEKVRTLHLEQPTPVESVKVRVQQELTAGRWSGPEKAAIGCAVAALGIMGLIFLGLYIRARFGKGPRPV